MRKYRDEPAPAKIEPQQPEGVIIQIRTYEVITALYGGGPIAGQNDELLKTLVRGTTIRGQLRFWWRATRGGTYSNIAEMKQAEDEIWGKAHKKGDEVTKSDQLVQISVEVHKPDESKEIKPFRIAPNASGKNQSYPANGIPGYAAFPLQPDQKALREENPLVVPVRKNIFFKLTISFPTETQKEENGLKRKVKQEIEAALWAWETFGGIGARTRRGFGAIKCLGFKETCSGKEHIIQPDLSPSNRQGALQWLQEKLSLHVIEGKWPKNVPHLDRVLVEDKHFVLTHCDINADAITIWNDLINRLYLFRQMRPDRQNRRSPGRSKWPEPDAIRYYTRQRIDKHAKPIIEPPVHKFPRAAFGLPIIFKFKDSNNNYPQDENYDPRKTVLQPKGYERFASPLILKPLACQNGYVGLALILVGTSFKDISLELKAQQKPQLSKEVEAELEQCESFTLTDNELTTPIVIDHNTDILQAFLRYLRIYTYK